MVKCIVLFKYRPSWALIFTTIATLIYTTTPISLFKDRPFYISYLDDIVVVFIFLKVLSTETHRFARAKAKGRRCCGNV